MVREIALTRGKVALVDDDDFERISATRWRARRGKRINGPDAFYALGEVKRDGKRVGIEMHRVIMGEPEAFIDHIDGDGLNNLRSNLRICTNSLNQANRALLLPIKASRFRGVTWHKQSSRWQAAIKVLRRSIYLGLFDTEEEAAVAYDTAASVHFGPYARLNFPKAQVAA